MYEGFLGGWLDTKVNSIILLITKQMLFEMSKYVNATEYILKMFGRNESSIIVIYVFIYVYF